MNKFNNFINQLDQMDSKQSSNVPHSKFSSRKFPKRQYKRLNRRLWTCLISIIVMISGGASYYGFHLQIHDHSAAVQKRPDHYRRSQIRHSSYSDLIPSNRASASQTQSGKSLLKTWLNKLDCPKVKSNNILNIYQNTTPFWRHKINYQLRQVTKAHLKTSIKKQQVYTILIQAKMIDPSTLRSAVTGQNVRYFNAK